MCKKPGHVRVFLERVNFSFLADDAIHIESSVLKKKPKNIFVLETCKQSVVVVSFGQFQNSQETHCILH